LKIRSSCVVVLSLCTLSAQAAVINLGSADSFAVLAGTTVTNTGPTIIDGNLGVWSGSAVTGFLPGIVNGTIDADDSIAMQAQGDLATAYSGAVGEACGGGNDLTGQDLGVLTLTAGVYCFSSSAQLTGTLTLDAQGDPGALFLIQMGSTLTTASASSVVLINGGQGSNLYWQVGSSATLGTTTEFAGSILALTSITLTTGANITDGRALAINGAVTMDTNHISIGSQSATTPEPGSATLFGAGLLLCAIGYKRRLRGIDAIRRTN
jgi:hypothetical protein